MRPKQLIFESRASAPFTFLLATLLLLVLVHPIFRGWRHGLLLFQIFVSLILIAGMLALGPQRRIVIVGLLLAVPAFAFRWSAHATGNVTLSLLALSFQAGFLTFVAAVILRQILRTSVVSVDTIVGGICVYLLLAQIWSSLYVLVETSSPGSFLEMAQSGAPLSGHHGRVFENSFYFSVTTLTTLGYGDIVPLTGTARALASVEAMVGQIYIAVFVARLIGLHTATRAGRKDD